MQNGDYIIVYSACDSLEVASAIAENLVTNKLAACVNIVKGVESIYQWKGKIERAQEIQLIIKTRQSLFPALQNAIQGLHNYELPEIIAVPICSGEENYLNWIQSTTLATEK